MDNIAIFGTGSGAEKVIKSLDSIKYKIVAYIDNNENMKDKIFKGIKVSAPPELCNIEYDKIIICSVAYKAIFKQLTEDYNIDPNKIENNLFFIKEKLMNYYDKITIENAELKEIVDYIKVNNLKVFNYGFSKKYDNYVADVHYDSNVNMFYVIHKTKKMYFKESFKNEAEIINYYRLISEEQDIDSPHSYLTTEFQVEKGDVVIDAGVAEGNFALDIIDDVEKIYLIEMDKGWIKALRETFKEYGDKVVFVDKYLTDFNDENNITLDQLIGTQNIDFIKMDIEGEEIKALHGSAEVLKRNEKLKLDICAYHNNNDEQIISNYISQFDFNISTSKGYMFFVNDAIYETNELRLVKGLLRGIKR